MNFAAPNAPLAVSAGIAIIAIAVWALFLWGNIAGAQRLGWHWERVRRHGVRVAVDTALWAGGFALAAWSGLLARFDLWPPPILVMMLVVIAGSVWFAFSECALPLVDGLPVAALVGFQAFRLPLEVVMHAAAMTGVMPVQMSYAGWNFDIVTGLTACVVAPLASVGRAPRWLIWSWNVLGSALLAAIGGIAIASTPAIRAFGDDRLNTWVCFFPFVWLPSILVAAALAGHIALFRRLKRRAQ